MFMPVWGPHFQKNWFRTILLECRIRISVFPWLLKISLGRCSGRIGLNSGGEYAWSSFAVQREIEILLLCPHEFASTVFTKSEILVVGNQQDEGFGNESM